MIDPSMDILYEDGKGPVYEESLSWLQSASEHLRMSGALAIGNFARNGKLQGMIILTLLQTVLVQIST